MTASGEKPLPSFLQETPVPNTPETENRPENRAEDLDSGHELIRLREDFQRRAERRQHENQQEIALLNQIISDSARQSEFLRLERAVNTTSLPDESVPDTCRSLEERLRLIARTKNPFSTADIAQQVSQTTAESGNLAGWLWQSKNKKKELDQQLSLLSQQLSDRQAEQAAFQRDPWVKKIWNNKKKGQLSAQIEALTGRKETLTAEWQRRGHVIDDFEKDLRSKHLWSYSRSGINIGLRNVRQRLDSEFDEIGSELARPELIQALILDRAISPDLTKIAAAYDYPLTEEQRLLYLESVQKIMPATDTPAVNLDPSQRQKLLERNLQFRSTFDGLPPALLKALLRLPGQVGAWVPLNFYQRKIADLAIFASQKENAEIRAQLNQNPDLPEELRFSGAAPQLSQGEFDSGLPIIRHLAVQTGLVPAEFFKEYENQRLKTLGERPPSYSGNLSEEDIAHLTELRNPVALPYLLNHIRHAKDDTSFNRNGAALKAIADLYHTAEPQEREVALAQLSAADRDLIKLIADPRSGLNLFADKFSGDDSRTRFISERGTALIPHEANLAALIKLGETEENLVKFYSFSEPRAALLQLKKIATATGQDYRQKLVEALPLFDLSLLNKESVKISHQNVDNAKQWATELGIAYPELLRQIPDCLLKNISPENNALIADLVKSKNQDLAPVLQNLAQDKLKIKSENISKIATLLAQSEFLQDVSLRSEAWLFFSRLTKVEDGPEFLDNCLDACQNPAREQKEFQALCRIGNLIFSLNNRRENPVYGTRLLDQAEMPRGQNLSEIITALTAPLTKSFVQLSREKHLAQDKYFYRDQFKEDWQSLKQTLNPELFRQIIGQFGEKSFSYFSENREIFLDGLITAEQAREIIKSAAEKQPRNFIVSATRKDWQDVIGDRALTEFLNVLPTRTDEKRNAFTHNPYDRTSAFLYTLAEATDFSLRPADFQIISAYVAQFGLAKAPILFEYYRNIRQLESGKQTTLPAEQAADGIDSVAELEKRFKNINNLITAEKPYTEIAPLSGIERNLLSTAVGYATHSHSLTFRPSLETITTDFSRDLTSDRLPAAPPEYRVRRFDLSQVEYRIDQASSAEPFNLLVPEILAGIDQPAEIEGLQTRAGEKISAKIDELQQTLKNKDNQFIRGQIEKLGQLKQSVDRSRDLDQLMSTLLDLDRPTAEKSGFLPLIREIVFRRILEKQPPSNIMELSALLRSGVSAEGILKIIGLIDESVKEHALNLKNENREGYWSAETFAKIKQARENSKQVDVPKIFTAPLNRLKAERDKFETRRTGLQAVKAIPDRGLIGELSGYIANACYTAEYPLLRDRPNLVPYKFVAETAGETSLLGSVLAFELTQANGDQVMLMRAFNVPNETAVDTAQFVEEMLDELAAVGKKRGLKRIIVPGDSGAISNYPMTTQHILNRYVREKEAIALADSFNFNNHELQNKCFIARELQ